MDHYHRTDAYRSRRAAKCINGSLFNVYGWIFFLVRVLYLPWPLLLINIILGLIRLELNAFFCMNYVSTRHVAFHAARGSSLKAFPGRLQWSGQSKRRTKGCFVERGRVVTLWTSHYTEVALRRAAEHNQTWRVDLWEGEVGKVLIALLMTKRITWNFP